MTNAASDNSWPSNRWQDRLKRFFGSPVKPSSISPRDIMKTGKHVWFDTDRACEYVCHLVPALSGSDSPFYIARTGQDTEIVVFHDEYACDVNDDLTVTRYFADGQAAITWLKRSAYVVPSAALRALRANALAGPRAWPVLLDDILRIRRKSFTSRWSLSYENDDFGNSESFSSLSEAYDCLGDVGALMAVPGNSGSITIGSVRIFSTYFKSNGIDRGDSHIDPSTCSIGSDLFEGIVRFERWKASGATPALARNLASECHAP
jgi:hypothetical protein